jgi:hypothetical protein
MKVILFVLFGLLAILLGTLISTWWLYQEMGAERAGRIVTPHYAPVVNEPNGAAAVKPSGAPTGPPPIQAPQNEKSSEVPPAPSSQEAVKSAPTPHGTAHRKKAKGH